MSRDIINIKGTRQGLVIFLSQGYNFDELKNTLRNKMEASNGFFTGAKFVFHNEDTVLSMEALQQLENICCEHGLVPAGSIDVPFGIKSSSPEEETAAAVLPKASVFEPGTASATPSMPSIGILDEDKTACLRLDKNIRSGQKVYFDGNIIIDGDANPGSEITASGDIIVMGSLRGTAHAGAFGAADSVIVAYRMNPVQVRISSFVSRAPDNSIQETMYPEIARLQDNRIVIEPYSTFGLRRSKL